MLPRCLRSNQYIGVDLVDLEVRDGTSAKALNVVAGVPGFRLFSPVDKLHREDRDERVQNCLGETLWLAGDHCTDQGPEFMEVSSRTQQELQSS